MKRCCLIALRQCFWGTALLALSPQGLRQSARTVLYANARGGHLLPWLVLSQHIVDRRRHASRGESADKRFTCASVCGLSRPARKILNSFMSMQMLTAARCFSPIRIPSPTLFKATLTTAALPKFPPNTNELNPLPHPPHPRNFGSLFSCVFSAARRVLPVSRDHHGEAGFHFDGHTKRDFGGLSTPLEAA